MPNDQQCLSDKLLVGRALDGNQPAMIELLVDRFGPNLAYVAREFHIDPKDLLSELFVHLFSDNGRHLRSWRGESSVVTWLETVTRNLCLKKKRESAQDERLLAHQRNEMPREGRLAAPPKIAELDLQVSPSKLLAAVESLPNSEQKLLISLIYFSGYSVGDAAKKLRFSQDRTYVLHHRAIKRLKKLLAGEL